MSLGSGQKVIALTRDHKPSDMLEFKRIKDAGGQIYQTSTATSTMNKLSGSRGEAEFIVGPIRVLPGRLSVCRTFGDPEAKLAFRGGNPNVVKA